MRMLESPHFPPVPDLDGIVQYLVRDKFRNDPERIKEVAGLLLRKMDAGVTWPRELGDSHETALKRLERALRELPGEALRPHADLLLKISTKTEVRMYVRDILRKAAFLGKRLFPVALSSVNEGLELLKKDETRGWSVYVAGLKGLCAIGEMARPASDRLLGLLKEGRLPMSYGGGRSLDGHIAAHGSETGRNRGAFARRPGGEEQESFRLRDARLAERQKGSFHLRQIHLIA